MAIVEPPSLPNTSYITLPPLARIFFSGFSNAGLNQIITIEVDGKDIGVFKGAGENVPMKHTSGGKNDEVLSLDYSCEKRRCRAIFQFQGGAGAPPQSSTVSKPVIVGDSSIRSISINSNEVAPLDVSTHDDNDSQLKIDMVFTSKTNPTHVRIHKDMRAQVSCMANAPLQQNLSWWVLKVGDDWHHTEGEPDLYQDVFVGSGENKAMHTRDGKTSHTFKPEPYNRLLVGVFSVIHGGGERKPAKRVTKPLIVGNEMSNFTTVGAEDGNAKDKDNNDAVLRVVAMSAEFSDDEDDE